MKFRSILADLTSLVQFDCICYLGVMLMMSNRMLRIRGKTRKMGKYENGRNYFELENW